VEKNVQPIPRIDITAEVIERIKRLLASGDLRPGAKLVPEREFARILGISRPSLRQALKVLIAIGVVESKVGKGTYIRSESTSQMLEQSLDFLSLTGGVSLSELFEVRKVIEVELAGLAAMRAAPEDLAELRESLAAMSRTADKPKDYLPHNVNFHRLIAKAARNSLFYAVIDSLRRVLSESRRRTIKVEPVEVLLGDHAAIYQQIEARNVAGAREAMLKHLTRVQDHYESADVAKSLARSLETTVTR
jgi:GntR family transcriptional regulator, transcriptional repressor for pyruvate dehydrogenase complex